MTIPPGTNSPGLIMCSCGSLELVHTAVQGGEHGGEEGEPDNEGKTVTVPPTGMKYGS